MVASYSTFCILSDGTLRQDDGHDPESSERVKFPTNSSSELSYPPLLHRLQDFAATAKCLRVLFITLMCISTLRALSLLRYLSRLCAEKWIGKPTQARWILTATRSTLFLLSSGNVAGILALFLMVDQQIQREAKAEHVLLKTNYGSMFYTTLIILAILIVPCLDFGLHNTLAEYSSAASGHRGRVRRLKNCLSVWKTK